MSWPAWLLLGLVAAGAVVGLVLFIRREKRNDPCRGCPGCSPRSKRRAERSRG